MPLTIKLVSISSINLSEFFFQIRGQMNGRVEIFPDQSVMFHVPSVINWNLEFILQILVHSHFIKFCWVTFPVVKYLIPYTETIPIFSMARKRFYEIKMCNVKNAWCFSPWKISNIAKLRTDLLTWSRHQDDQEWCHWWTRTKQESP